MDVCLHKPSRIQAQLRHPQQNAAVIRLLSAVSYCTRSRRLSDSAIFVRLYVIIPFVSVPTLQKPRSNLLIF